MQGRILPWTFKGRMAQASNLRENKFLCFKLLSLWGFAPSAPGNKYTWSWNAPSENQHSSHTVRIKPCGDTTHAYSINSLSRTSCPQPESQARHLKWSKGCGEEVISEAGTLWMWDDLPNQPLLEFLIYRIVSKIKLFQATKFGSNLFHGHN